MVLFPHAKINLGLQVIEKRHDGYHSIISCLYPIDWCDVLEILEKPEISFTTSGLSIPGNPLENLCLKAYQLTKTRFDIPPVHIHLHKVVPIGAGLGGGSSDAAAVLKGLRTIFNLPLSNKDLQKMAAQLGSDCPFFINGVPTMVTGKGDQMANINIQHLQGHLVVITPPIHINTGEAYSMLTPKMPDFSLELALKKDISQWSKIIENDFERPIASQFPKIAEIKKILLLNGATYASLSGSGSTVFGIFEEKPDTDGWFGSDHQVWQQDL